jgi:hypothetical protein
MVVKGLIPTTARPFNGVSNLDALTLLALSTATPIHYEFMYGNPGDFNDSIYNKKFYTSYHGWLNDSVRSYKMFKDLAGDVAGERIVSYKQLSVDEYETVFEGGKTIYINLSTYEIKVDGLTIDLNQY